MINRTKFFSGVRQQPFSGKLTQGQVDGMNAILDEWERRELTDPRWLAYILATTKWETDHTMQPIREIGGPRKRYAPWYGRGYVQLTWKYNYEAFRDEVLKQFKVDIVAKPDNALIPEVAAYIMFEGMIRGIFSVDKRDKQRAKLGKYFNDKTTDWLNARRIINLMNRAADIAGIAKQFYADIVAST